jgi:ribose 5-phosphate isomerase B
MSIAANRHAGIRAALVLDAWTARMCRAHNNANIICLRAREQALKSNLQFLDIFIAEPFEGGRHADRLAKLNC